MVKLYSSILKIPYRIGFLHSHYVTEFQNINIFPIFTYCGPTGRPHKETRNIMGVAKCSPAVSIISTINPQVTSHSLDSLLSLNSLKSLYINRRILKTLDLNDQSGFPSGSCVLLASKSCLVETFF